MKSWESPRRGRRRNDKSKRSAARLRQLKKQRKQLRKRLQNNKPAKTPSGITPEGVLVEIRFNPDLENSQKQAV
ncbi:hypothetical protein [Acaryochloris sp. CCMEE 5410]|uniref:hypothetical protein n=1 Tax=Acaryochloris sp. CCMEE 5410 TaxID=310037 RepID=UPI0002483E6B|nr:hypothetical protein [Acaryochloris sp. CCMEE 5410]KAI9134595.1 hypothetical protein ON05_015820 [Acaryochloris sp. CCMEE 5410]